MTDEYQSIPVAVARAAVQESGLLESFDGPHFLAHEEADWRPYFIESQSALGHPILARVIITRVGQKPREVVVSWDEYAEDLELNDPQWAERRAQKPMSIFGAEVERHAYRVVFADVLAKIDRPAPATWEPPTAQGYCGMHPTGTMEPCAECAETRKHRDGWEPEGSPVRDWHADLAAASTKPEVDALFEEARAAKALKDATLHEAFTRRLREVLAQPKQAPDVAAVSPSGEVKPGVDSWTPKPTPAPTLGAVPSPVAVAAKSKPLTVQPARRPQGDRPQGQRRRGKR